MSNDLYIHFNVGKVQETTQDNKIKQLLKLKRLNLYTTSIIFIVAVFSLLTLPDGQAWGDDFAMYLMHARNIAEGQAYSETGYIFNDLEPEYAPQNYPPGFPLLIAPIYKFAGLQFYPYKIFILISFLIFLYLSYKFLSKYLDPLYTFIVIFLLAFSPFFWEYRNHILSDIPAAVFFMLSLLLARKVTEHPNYRSWLLLVLVIFAAYLIRPVCIVVLPATILHMMHVQRKLKWQSVFGIILFCILAWISELIVESDSGYLSTTINEIQNSGFFPFLNRLLLKFHLYIFSFEDFAVGSTKGSQLNKCFFYLLAYVILIGLFKNFRKKPDFIAYTLFFYFGIILIWPAWQGLRFFIPVLPLFFYYIFYLLSGLKNLRLQKIIILSITSILIFLFGNYYFTSPYYKEVPYGIQEASATEIFNYIRNELPADAIIMSSKPRAYCLFTGKKGIVFPEHHPDLLKENMSDYKVFYLVIAKTESKGVIASEMKDDMSSFEEVYQNSGFTLYKVKQN